MGEVRMVDDVRYVSTPITKEELFPAISRETKALMATGAALHMAVSTLPLRRRLSLAAQEVYLTEIRFMLPVAEGTPTWLHQAAVREVGRLREAAVTAMVDYEAARRALWYWGKAAAQACVMLERRGLPSVVVKRVSAFL